MSESNVRHMMLDDGMTGGTGTDDVMIEVTDLRKSYGNVEVIKGVDLTVHRGEVICIIGPSGAGKSTLLRCLNGLEHATSGRIVVNGHDLNDPKVNIDKVREQVGMVFQHFNLFNNMSVIDNITLAPKLVHKESRSRHVSTPCGCSKPSDWPKRPTPCHVRFPAARSSAWPSRVRWPCARR